MNVASSERPPFPIGMGTGAVYVVLSGLHHRSQPVIVIETFFFFLNIALFTLNSTTLLLQAILYPRQALRLLKDPVKGIFVPLVVLSVATIIIGTINYAWPTGHMLVGVVAFNVLKVMDPADNRALGVLLTGYFFQGLGFFMTFIYICIYIIRFVLNTSTCFCIIDSPPCRIMSTGFLEGHQANGAFVACGPPGFTALALINLGSRAREILPKHDLISPTAGEIWFSASIMAALMLWGLAVFFFFFGALPYWFKLHKHLNEILGCWALTFPNVGWIATMRLFGDIFKVRGFYVTHAIMATLICLAWLVLFVLTVVAFWRGLIFHSKDEDVIKDTLPEAVEEEDDEMSIYDKKPDHHHGRDISGPNMV
ncbi:hypothetical protein EYR40_009213 [Pleurotus pulmonarius]|nr:hypothetical protein EYR40_009213 [Pleurotus pulmonarius]